jgi:death-on-curing protein
VNYLDLIDLVAIGKVVLSRPMEVRDWGLVESALARPRATVFGEEAYPSVFDKAAALLLSLVTNRPLVDGNKRVGFTAAALFLRKNAFVLRFQEDEAYDFVISVADGSRREVADVAAVLARWAEPAPH